MSETSGPGTVAENTARDLVERLTQARLDVPVALVGRLATLIGEEEVRYFSARFGQQPQAFTGEIVVFTDHHVFHQTSQMGESQSVGIVVRVRARRDLRELVTTGAENTQSDAVNRNDGPWPWPMTITVAYDGWEAFTLPLSGHARGDDADLQNLTRALLREL